MAYSKALDIVRQKLKIEVDRLSESIADGTAKTYEEYKFQCGKIQGITVALREMEAYLKEDDDED